MQMKVEVARGALQHSNTVPQTRRRHQGKCGEGWSTPHARRTAPQRWCGGQPCQQPGAPAQWPRFPAPGEHGWDAGAATMCRFAPAHADVLKERRKRKGRTTMHGMTRIWVAIRIFPLVVNRHFQNERAQNATEKNTGVQNNGTHFGTTGFRCRVFSPIHPCLAPSRGPHTPRAPSPPHAPREEATTSCALRCGGGRCRPHSVIPLGVGDNIWQRKLVQ